MLGQIAVFMIKGFEYARGPTMRPVRAYTAQHFIEFWWLVVGMNENMARTVKNEIERGEGDVVMGALRFSDTIEIECPDSEKCIVKDDTLIGEKTGHQICIVPFVAEMVILDFNIKTSDPKLYPLLNPKRQLIKAIQYNLNISGKIKKDIELNQFTSIFYDQLKSFLPFFQQERSSEYLKGMLHNKAMTPGLNDLFIAVFYNFVYGGKQKMTTLNLDKMLFAKEELHFNMTNGVIKIAIDGSLYCENELIVSISRHIKDANESVCAVLPNFTMKRVYKLQKGISTQSTAWLNHNSDSLPEGFKAYTMFQTAIFEVKKTSTIENTNIKYFEKKQELELKKIQAMSYQPEDRRNFEQW